jgi:hypothetical protein
MHLITRIDIIDSHKPGQSAMIDVDCALCNTMPMETKRDMRSKNRKIRPRMCVC